MSSNKTPSLVFLGILFLSSFCFACFQITDCSAAPIDPAASMVVLVGADSVGLFICPHGDGDTFASKGVYIQIQVIDTDGLPVLGIPAEDFWLVDGAQSGSLVLCGGSNSCDADSATNDQGITTISGTVAAGGYSNTVSVMVQGVLITDPENPGAKILPVRLRSPDYDANLSVNMVDLSRFAARFAPYYYYLRSDLNFDGTVDLIDFGYFGLHSTCTCSE